jgi:hypothetical protein
VKCPEIAEDVYREGWVVEFYEAESHTIYARRISDGWETMNFGIK